MSELDGRSAMVTGGGAGIGLACVRALAEAGASVHVVDRDTDAARSAADEVGGHAHVIDLAEHDSFEQLPRDVDILVNNAGIQHVSPVQDFPVDTFMLIQQVMLTGPFVLAQRFLPHMYEREWGRIVNISSVHGLRASPGKSAYVAAKHGLEGLSKTLALEGAQHGVTSNCVNPGYVRTALVENQIDSQAAVHGMDRGDVVDDVLLHRSAIKRLIEPEEVAATVAWLCGPHAAYISGTSLAMDGAWMAS